MINLLLGAPGAGKSYEAVVFHVLPALERGRKVITNLPLVIEEFEKINPEYRALIEIRLSTLAERPEVDLSEARRKWETLGVAHKPVYFNNVAFSHPEDFGDSWRHPVEGFGPLYVIDECHIPLPSRGTPIKVEEWFSLHRHETADVLLITQSYGKVNRAVIDLVQACYRVRKNIAFGSSNSYVRKVQDGVRGAVMNTTIRKYQKPYFKFYKSHTRGGGSELGAQDIVPIWRHWSFMGAALLFLIFFIMLFSGAVKTPWKIEQKKIKPSLTEEKKSSPLVYLPGDGRPRPQKIQPSAVVNQEPIIEQSSAVSQISEYIPKKSLDFGPLNERSLHFGGSVTIGKVTKSLFVVSQNGQRVSTLSGAELEQAGYKVEVLNDCMAKVTYNETVSRFALCDVPQVGVVVAGHAVQGRGSVTGGGPARGGVPSRARS